MEATIKQIEYDSNCGTAGGALTETIYPMRAALEITYEN